MSAPDAASKAVWMRALASFGVAPGTFKGTCLVAGAPTLPAALDTRSFSAGPTCAGSPTSANASPQVWPPALQALSVSRTIWPATRTGRACVVGRGTILVKRAATRLM
jgi:hypothetical protein